MAHASSKIPDPKTYERVLRRYDRDPRHAHQIRYVGYDVSLRAVAAELDGVTAPTLFFPRGKSAAVHRATRVGWVDETEKWNIAIARQLDPEWTAKQLAAIESGIKALTWNKIRGYAKKRKIDAVGDRADLENRIMEWHKARLSKE